MRDLILRVPSMAKGEAAGETLNLKGILLSSLSSCMRLRHVFFDPGLSFLLRGTEVDPESERPKYAEFLIFTASSISLFFFSSLRLVFFCDASNLLLEGIEKDSSRLPTLDSNSCVPAESDDVEGGGATEGDEGEGEGMDVKYAVGDENRGSDDEE